MRERHMLWGSIAFKVLEIAMTGLVGASGVFLFVFFIIGRNASWLEVTASVVVIGLLSAALIVNSRQERGIRRIGRILMGEPDVGLRVLQTPDVIDIEERVKDLVLVVRELKEHVAAVALSPDRQGEIVEGVKGLLQENIVKAAVDLASQTYTDLAKQYHKAEEIDKIGLELVTELKGEKRVVSYSGVKT